MNDERATIEELQAELDCLPGKIEAAVRAGDVGKLLQLRGRKSVLPILIGNKQLAVLEDELVERESASEDLSTKVRISRERVEKAKTEVKSVEELLKEAESAVNLADGDRGRNNSKIEGLHKRIQALKAGIEEAVSAASG